jgi:hypothetical protein
VTHEGEIGEGAQHEPVDSQRGRRRPGHDGDRRARADDLGRHRELVDAVGDLERASDVCRQVIEDPGEGEAGVHRDPSLVDEVGRTQLGASSERVVRGSAMCSVFAFVVQLWAVRRTSATRASILMGTEPVWALAVGVAIGGEVVGLPGLAGAALIVAASYAGQAIERRHRRSLAEASGGADGEAVSSGPRSVAATAPRPSP